MTLTDRIEELARLYEAAEQRPICMDYAYSGIRHLQRNCDMQCESHEDGSDCVEWGRHDGTAVGSIWNAFPELLPVLRAAVAYVEARATTARLQKSSITEADWDAFDKAIDEERAAKERLVAAVEEVK